MKVDLFDYHLPKELIAQKPAKPRDASRLLVLHKDNGKIEHRHFYDLADMLNENDILVLNETKVFPARLLGKKKTGGRAEVFLVEEIKDNFWEAMIGAHGMKVDDIIYLDKKLEARLIDRVDDKVWRIQFNKSGEELEKIIEKIGHTPLPPYIKTKDSNKIRKDYQTIFAKSRGSIAAPTAGLHFTENLLNKIANKNIKIYKIILHVGLGTFAPVAAKEVAKHDIHKEWISLNKETAQELNKLKEQGKNIIAVGTTTVRALESFADESGQLEAGSKWTSLYIYPGYQFKFVDELITNFHLPKSSLLFLVSALANRGMILNAYNEAVKQKYRFYSFGDAMFIRS